MKMTPRKNIQPILMATAAVLLGFSTQSAKGQTTGWNQTGVGPFDYNDTANWVGGIINGIFDMSVTIPSSQTVTFGQDTVLTTGFDFSYTGSSNEVLRGTGGDFTLTLGGDILHNTASTTRVINFGSTAANQALAIDLGGVARIFTVGSGRSLGFLNGIGNGSVITSGGTINFSGSNSYGGATTVASGVLALNGAVGSSANSDIMVQSGGSSTSTLQFNSTTNLNTGTTRAKSVTLNGAGSGTSAFLTVTGNAGANSVETITNALRASAGYATVGVTAPATRAVRLSVGSFVRDAGASLLFRGSNLGLDTLANQTPNFANIQFAQAPALSGSGVSGQATVGILKGAYGDVTSGGDGKAGGLVTYDSTYGVRLLTSGEYVGAITDGQTTASNVLFTRASGDASQDITLASTTTTLNSLSFKITGAGTNSGVTIAGAAGTTLKLNSGTIFASQQVTTANATDAMTISVPTLDLNGGEGVVTVFTNGVSNGNTAAPLTISSVIANDGGKGVTFGGTGETILTGSEANTYTGTTTLNSGILRLNKSVVNIGLTTDLVMNGGTLLKTGNAIADTASVTINGGTFTFDSTTSSGNNNHPETINNFTMNGGGVSNHGLNATFTINGNATLNAGNLIMNQGGDVTVLGATTLNGGVLTAKESSSTTAFNGLTTLNTLNISNQATGAYTPLVLTSHATMLGAKVTLNGDVTFTGNATNSNPTSIASSNSALTNQGSIYLEGTRTFTIGDGAAASDLFIELPLTNGVAVGGLAKAGLGTLELGGANTFTGPANVGAGTLVISGSISGAASVGVAAGATLASDAAASVGTAATGNISVGGTLSPGGNGANGALTLSPGTGGKLDFAAGSKLRLDLQLAPANSDIVTFTGTDDWLSGSGFATLTLGGAIDYTATYTVFQNVSTPGFTFAAITGFNSAAYTANFAQSGSDYQLSFVPVPEPATGALLLGGFGLLAGLRRRRDRHAGLRDS